MTERQELLAEAEKLGLSFASNAKTEVIKKAVLAALDGADTIELPEQPVVTFSEEDIRKQLEIEFAEKLEVEKQKITNNFETNMVKDVGEKAVGYAAIGKAKMQARKEATRQVRVIVTCKDPAKQNWEGEIITVGNDVIGDIKKYVPFNIEEGYHIPQIIYNMLKDRECTIFVNKKGKDGKYVQTAKIIKAHSVEVLPDLTQEELDALAAEQSARMAID